MYSELIQRRAEYNDDKVSDLFFSSQNIDKIQKMIQMNVYTKTSKQYKISRQSDSELFILMTGIYSNNSRHLPHHIQEQVDELNELTTIKATQLILPRLLQYIGYMNTLDKRLDVLDYAVNTSSIGDKI